MTQSEVGRVFVEITNNTNGFITEFGAVLRRWVFPSRPTSRTSLARWLSRRSPIKTRTGTGGGLTQTLNFSFDYATSNAGGGRFDAGEKISFYLNAGPDLTASSFADAAYMHIQGIPVPNGRR